MANVTKLEMLNTEVLDKVFPTSKMVGGHKVEIRSYKEVAGHDDSVPYQAKVFVDGKEVAVAYNDGWGGQTNVSATKESAYPVLKEVEKYIHEHKNDEELFMGEYQGIRLYHTDLASICDTLATNFGNRKIASKKADKCLVLYCPQNETICTVPFFTVKTLKFSDFVGDHKFKTLWYDTIAKYEAKGYTILSVKDIFRLLQKVA